MYLRPWVPSKWSGGGDKEGEERRGKGRRESRGKRRERRGKEWREEGRGERRGEKRSRGGEGKKEGRGRGVREKMREMPGPLDHQMSKPPTVGLNLSE